MTSDMRVLAVNGGSSSIKLALFKAGDPPQRILHGEIERIGLPGTCFRVESLNPTESFSRPLTGPDQSVAVSALMDWLERRKGPDAATAVGHRVVLGGPTYTQPQRVTAAMLAELRLLSPLDPEHLPEEILLTEALHRRFPACPKWRASTPRSITTSRVLRGCSQSRGATRHSACGDTGFTVSPTLT